MKVLNFGSINIDYVYKVEDFVKKGQTISSESLNVFSGGKGLNQSIALGKAGIEVYHAGKIGTDGLAMKVVLNQANVNTDYILVDENKKTGHAIIQKNKENDNCILLYSGANRELNKDDIDKVLDNFCSGDFLVVQNEVNKLDYIIEKAYEKGMIIFLNPAPMDKHIFNVNMEHVDYLILNEYEAENLLNVSFKDYKKVIYKIKETYDNLSIVLTLGEKGCMYLDDNDFIIQDSYKVKTVDTTAAGDTFTGYFIASLILGYKKDECLKIASKAAAIAVTIDGAAPSIPNIKNVLEGFNI